jgi:integrase
MGSSRHLCCAGFGARGDLRGCRAQRVVASWPSVDEASADSVVSAPVGYSAAYVGPDLRLHRAPETFKAKIDAEGWLAAEHRQIDLDQWVPPQRRHHRIAPESDPTVGSYATAWLEDRSERDANDPMALRLSSVKDYELTLKNHIIPKLGSIRLAELDASDIETWYRALGARKTPRARAKAYSLLRTILNAAKNDSHAPLTENPAHIKGAGRVPRSTQIHPATLDELQAITQAMPDKLRLAAQLGAWCALRYAEVFELRRKDLDLQTGVVHVRRGVVWTRGMVTTDRPKTSAGVRDVTIARRTGDPAWQWPVLQS